MRKSGFTLIETIAVIVVLGICLAPLSVLIVNVMQGNAQPQAFAIAVGLAEAEMENITTRRYSNITNQSAAAFAAPYSNFNLQVIAENVDSTTLNTPTANATNYKRVRIIVSNQIAGNVTLTTLVTNDW